MKKRCELCNDDILDNEEYLGDGTPGVNYAHMRCVNPNDPDREAK